jgi:DNA polymerase I-like protein with 3'-5' exonuclease and polymerase domains
MDEDDTAPTKDVLAQCNTYLSSTILSTRPKIIIAMGAAVMRQLGFKLKHKDARGKFFTHPQFKAQVLVTFSQKALLAKPGLFETYKLDIQNAFERSQRGPDEEVTLEKIAGKYTIPTTVEEAVQVCDDIVSYAKKGDPANWAISVDTETTTLYPEKASAKVIGFCFGWGDGLATTILYEHPHAPQEYLDRLPEIREAIQRVLETFKPKIFHNAKFDLKFIELKCGFTVRNVVWDTLLGEHLLDEDKKGSYGLKSLTAGWLPNYCGYEDKLYDLLMLQAGISQVEATDKEISDQEVSLQEDHPEYLAALKAFRDELVSYTIAQKQYALDMEVFALALEGYVFVKAHLAGQQAAWRVEVSDWPKGKRGKPKKPVKWFRKPKKPKAIKKAKRPKDPRTKKEKQISKDAGFENVPIRELQIYGAVDADVTRQLTQVQQRRIKKEGSKVARLMRSHAIPATRVLGAMEYNGLKVNRPYIAVLDEGLRKIVNSTEYELYQMAGTTKADGTPLNLNHAGTLANVLYHWGWKHPDGTQMAPHEILARTKKGQPSTSAKLLGPMVRYEDEDKKIPTQESYFIERLLRWRKSSKALNTFLANVRVLSKRDGFLHTQFHLNGTGTGRLSSSDMNMQNIPKFLAGWNIKKLFIPDNEDFVIVNVDYKGAEVRVFTAYAKDEKLIQALKEGLDMHCFFAHKVFGKPYEKYAHRGDATFIPDEKERKLLDQERSTIKRVVFGILYGAGPMKISETIGVSFDEAKALIALLYEMFPAIKTYAERIEQEVLRNGFVETHFFRRRRFPLAHISRHRSRAVRQARNFKIQSTSSDIVVAQLVEIDEPLRNTFPGARHLLTVHDSMVFQFPKKHLLELREFVTYYAEQRVSEKYPWLPVPFKVDIEIGPSYGECQDIDKYLAKHRYVPRQEGIVEENELLTELREDAFVAA